MHTDFAIHLYNNYGVNKLSEERIKEIVLGAYEIEKEFVLESLPVRLIGMNSDSMVKYLQYVVDTHLKKLNLSPIFKATSPFTFMETIAIPTKRNFFEGRVNEYQRGNSDGMEGNKITFDADF
jgi:ribonucleoside-diphosphate reductase beta chain